MLRKSLLKFAPLALGAFVGTALADDSSVTLYGIVDAAVANIQHSLNFDQYNVTTANPTIIGQHGTSVATGLVNGGMSQSRFGIKGQEDMGGGIKGIFLLESCFTPTSGQLCDGPHSLANNRSTGPNSSADSSIAGQMFSRGAYVGLSSSEWGTLTLGRQQSFFLDNVGTFDPLLGSQFFSPFGYSGSYGGGGDTDDARVDGSLKYKVNISDFTVGLLYKLGGVGGSSTQQSAYQFNVVYATGPLAVQAGYEKFKDAFSLSNGATNGVVAATANDTTAWEVGAKYTLDALTVRGGYEWEQFKDPSNPGCNTVANGLPVSNSVCAAGVLPNGDSIVNNILGQNVSTMNVAAYPQSKTYNVFWIGGQYDFTSQFTTLLGIYHVKQNDYDPTGCSNGKELGRCEGSYNFYSLVADYHFTKRTDTYGGILLSNASQGLAVGLGSKTDPINSERTIAIGLRHVF